MKKILLGLIIFILVGCNANEIDQAKKKDVVLEANQKIKIEDVFDLSKIKNEDLKKALSKATITLDSKENKVIDKKDIKDDKIFASNVVKVTYTEKDKENSVDVDVKIKDTKMPKVNLNNDYYFIKKGSAKTKSDFIKELDLKVSDDTKYSVDIIGYDKVDFNKVKESKLQLQISDQANNVVKKDITLYVGNPSKTVTMNFNSNDLPSKISLYIPSYITSYYDVQVIDKKNSDSNEHMEIIFKSGKTTYNLKFFIPMIQEHNGYKNQKDYQSDGFYIRKLWGDYVRYGDFKKYKDDGSIIALATNTNYIFVGFILESKNATHDQFDQFLNMITSNIKVN